MVSIIDSKDMNLTKLGETVKPGMKSGVLQSMGSQRVGDELATEQHKIHTTSGKESGYFTSRF